MTEPRPAYRTAAGQSGPELTKNIVTLLTTAGYVVKFFNHNAPMPQGARGMTDIIAFCVDHTLLIEVKGTGDRIRPAQAAFAERLQPHLGAHLRYVVARSVEDVADAIGV
jgi:hypothetical protein